MLLRRKTRADGTPLPSSQQPSKGSEGGNKLQLLLTAVGSTRGGEERWCNSGRYNKHQNNCRMTFWHSSVGMIHDGI